jgi:tetratricopeptide (TPR) repeat protein
VREQLDKNEDRARLVLGLLLSELYKNRCALDLFKDALFHDPSLAAAHVRMGFVYSEMGSHSEMIRAFERAVRLDPHATRSAACKEPEEVGLINNILYPAHPQPFVAETLMPAAFREAGDLVAAAMKHLVQEHDVEAREALERSVRIDPTFPLAVALLSLTYILLGECFGNVSPQVSSSILWEAEPDLANLLFKG